MQPSAIITEYTSKNKALRYLSDPRTRVDDLSFWPIIPRECTAAEYMPYYLSHEKVAGSSVNYYVLHKVSDPSSAAIDLVAKIGIPCVEDGLEWSSSECFSS